MRPGSEAGKFGMEMPAGEIFVVGDFGENVGHQIGCAGIVIVVKLRTNRSEAHRQCNVSTDILIGVFDADPHGPVLVWMIGGPELGSSRVWHSYHEILILVIGDGQIDRHWAEAVTVGRQPTPGLTA